MYSTINKLMGIFALSLCLGLGFAPTAEAQNQSAALFGAASGLQSGAQTQGNNAMMAMMMAQQLNAAADALNCEEKKKEEKAKCEEQAKKLRELAQQMMMMAMQQQQSADDMAKKGEEAAKAGNAMKPEEEDKGAEEQNEMAELEKEMEEMKEEYEDKIAELEEENQNLANGGGNQNTTAGNNTESGNNSSNPNFAFLYDGELGNQLTWFEDEFGVGREDLASTVLAGESIGGLIAGKGAFSDMSATEIDAAIAAYQPEGDMLAVVQAMQGMATDVRNGRDLAGNDGDAVNATNSNPDASVAVNNGSVSIRSTGASQINQDIGHVQGASQAQSSTGKCETHFETKVQNGNLSGYVVSVCGDKVFPGAVSFSTASGQAKKSNSNLANSPHNAHSGYEQWKLKDCNYIYKPNVKQLTVDACKPNIVGTVTINGKDYVGPYFFNVEPLGQNVFSEVTYDRVEIWSATNSGAVIKAEVIDLEKALNFVQGSGSYASN